MTRQIAVRLPEGLVVELDGAVERGHHDNRTEVVRAALESYLVQLRRAAVDDAIREGYRRHPQAGVDVWGDLDAQSAAVAGRAGAALDAEDGGW